jgi:hypothetical protein
MSHPIIAPALAGNVLGSINASFVLAEWRDAGGPPGPPRWIAPLHVHHRDDEAWYVVEGTLRVKRGDEEVEAHAGGAVFVPRGTPNTYGLIQAIHGARDRSAGALQALFRQHHSELL